MQWLTLLFFCLLRTFNQREHLLVHDLEVTMVVVNLLAVSKVTKSLNPDSRTTMLSVPRLLYTVRYLGPVVVLGLIVSPAAKIVG